VTGVDPHTPTVAAPDPGAGGPSPAAPLQDPHPEVRVGVALAGGLVVARVLKALARRRQR
jgi:hypothetical protein